MDRGDLPGPPPSTAALRQLARAELGRLAHALQRGSKTERELFEYQSGNSEAVAIAEVDPEDSSGAGARRAPRKISRLRKIDRVAEHRCALWGLGSSRNRSRGSSQSTFDGRRSRSTGLVPRDPRRGKHQVEGTGTRVEGRRGARGDSNSPFALPFHSALKSFSRSLGSRSHAVGLPNSGLAIPFYAPAVHRKFPPAVGLAPWSQIATAPRGWVVTSSSARERARSGRRDLRRLVELDWMRSDGGEETRPRRGRKGTMD